jgi:hypothetical protein
MITVPTDTRAIARWLIACLMLSCPGMCGCGSQPAPTDAAVTPDAVTVQPDAPDAPMCLPTGATCVLAEDCCSMACLVGDPMTCI